MRQPRVKIAVVSGQNRLLIGSDSAMQIAGVLNDSHVLSSGSIEIEIDKAEPAPLEEWLWCGKYFRKEEAANHCVKLASKGIESRLWEVGLNPVKGEWSHREYRLLVRLHDEAADKRELLHNIEEVFPEIVPVEIQLPTERPSFIINLKDSSGRETRIEKAFSLNADSPLQILEAPVGEGFHWQHFENLEFEDSIWVDMGIDGKLCCGVEIDIEDYLTSVNSSEMPADSPQEFLKAQVVAARSWLLANWGSHHPGEPYTICGGDHCQCYYGPSRIRESSKAAVNNTRGELLMYDGTVCDARYAKTCGGMTEPAANVWSFSEEPYLGHIRDLPGEKAVDFSDENKFREFQQRNEPVDSCCAPGYAELKGRLVELAELYRWDESLSNGELSAIILNKTGVDPGRILNLIPGIRGQSGRLIELDIIGENAELSLSPELEIRRVLSQTHLPSSAFWIERTDSDGFIFHGLGWGHGVGLCQMGAVSLAARGMGHKSILAHYFPNTSIQKIY